MAHTCYEGVDKQYKQLQGSLKNVRQQLGSLMTCSTTKQDPTISGRHKERRNWSPDTKGEGHTTQGVLDYTKQLSEKVFTAFQTVSKATSYLPHHLKSGATQAFTYSQELYTTLKSVSLTFNDVIV